MLENNRHLSLSQWPYSHSNALPIVTPSATVLVESPFFLQPARDSSPGNKLSQINEDKFNAPSIFPLTKLPVELQLRVLWHCLVSSLPILNAGIPGDNQFALLEDEIRGQRRINPAVIFTCKAYYHEGIKLLYANNHFSYTCNRPPQNWLEGVGENLSRIEKLILRPLCSTDSMFTHEAAVIPMYWLQYFQHLKTLQIDFCGTHLGYQYKWDEDHDSMSLLVETLDNLVVDRMRKGSSMEMLSELVLTGLPESDIGLLVLKSMSMLLRTGSKVGIGTGSEGKKYVVDPNDYCVDEERRYMILCNDRPRLKEVDPQIHWIRVEDVSALIQRAASDTSSEWLFGDLGLVSERPN